MSRGVGPLTFRDVVSAAGRGQTSLMWLTTVLPFRSSIKVMLTECPKGHERTLTIDQRQPEREWTLTCPLCGGEHSIVAPEILRSDL